jgi:hypothetical protein
MTPRTGDLERRWGSVAVGGPGTPGFPGSSLHDRGDGYHLPFVSEKRSRRDIAQGRARFEQSSGGLLRWDIITTLGYITGGNDLKGYELGSGIYVYDGARGWMDG